MAKSKEELNQIKEDVKKLADQINELSDDELELVAAGDNGFLDILKKIGEGIKDVIKPVIK